MSGNPYAPPEANLNKAAADIQAGSLENGLAGHYEFTLRGIWSHAWANTQGAKVPLFIGVLIAVAVAVLLTQALARLGLDGQAMIERGEFVRGNLVSTLAGILISPVTVPMFAGLMMMAVRRAAGQPIRVGDLFRYYNRVVPLVILSLTSTVMIYLGMILCVLPGIYLSIAYIVAMPVMLDKNLSPWQALEASRKAMTFRWFGVFGLLFVTGAAMMVASIPVITMFWTFPWFFLCLGTLYVTAFGVEPSTLGATSAPGGTSLSSGPTI